MVTSKQASVFQVELELFLDRNAKAIGVNGVEGAMGRVKAALKYEWIGSVNGVFETCLCNVIRDRTIRFVEKEEGVAILEIPLPLILWYHEGKFFEEGVVKEFFKNLLELCINECKEAVEVKLKELFPEALVKKALGKRYTGLMLLMLMARFLFRQAKFSKESCLGEILIKEYKEYLLNKEKMKGKLGMEKFGTSKLMTRGEVVRGAFSGEYSWGKLRQKIDAGGELTEEERRYLRSIEAYGGTPVTKVDMLHVIAFKVRAEGEVICSEEEMGFLDKLVKLSD